MYLRYFCGFQLARSNFSLRLAHLRWLRGFRFEVSPVFRGTETRFPRIERPVHAVVRNGLVVWPNELSFLGHVFCGIREFSGPRALHRCPTAY
jgi:hypothetical protein